MSAAPDYTSYTLEQLQDAAANINREKYPERHALIMAEIDRRNDDDDAWEDLSLREFRDAEASAARTKVLRITAGAIEIAVGAMGGIVLLSLAVNATDLVEMNFWFAALMGLVCASSIVAGGLLLRGLRTGLLMSIGVAVVQIPIVQTSSMIVNLGLPMPELGFAFHFSIGSIAFGVNLLPVVTLVLLTKVLNNTDFDERPAESAGF